MLSITAVPSAKNGGDGFVNVGFIEATGLDLISVSVRGDLGRINAGDNNAATVALGSLQVHSMGLFGFSTQGSSPSLYSQFVGPVGKLAIGGPYALLRMEGARLARATPVDENFFVADLQEVAGKSDRAR